MDPTDELAQTVAMENESSSCSVSSSSDSGTPRELSAEDMPPAGLKGFCGGLAAGASDHGAPYQAGSGGGKSLKELRADHERCIQALRSHAARAAVAGGYRSWQPASEPSFGGSPMSPGSDAGNRGDEESALMEEVAAEMYRLVSESMVQQQASVERQLGAARRDHEAKMTSLGRMVRRQAVELKAVRQQQDSLQRTVRLLAAGLLAAGWLGAVWNRAGAMQLTAAFAAFIWLCGACCRAGDGERRV